MPDSVEAKHTREEIHPLGDIDHRAQGIYETPHRQPDDGAHRLHEQPNVFFLTLLYCNQHHQITRHLWFYSAYFILQGEVLIKI